MRDLVVSGELAGFRVLVVPGGQAGVTTVHTLSPIPRAGKQRWQVVHPPGWTGVAASPRCSRHCRRSFRRRRGKAV